MPPPDRLSHALSTDGSTAPTAFQRILAPAAAPQWDKVRNLLQYHRLRLWRARTYEPRLHAFRQRHRLLPYHTAAAAVAAAGGGPAAAAAVAAAGGSRCHLRGTVVVTGADWGLLEPQPLPPAVKLVGPLAVGPPAPLPPELAEHVAGAKHGTAVVAFPPDYW